MGDGRRGWKGGLFIAFPRATSFLCLLVAILMWKLLFASCVWCAETTLLFWVMHDYYVSQ